MNDKKHILFYEEKKLPSQLKIDYWERMSSSLLKSVLYL